VSLPPGITPDSSCPRLFEVPASLDNYEAIRATYSAASPRAATPTGESLLRIAGVNYDRTLVPGGFAATPMTGPKIVVLATDGDPNTCDGPYTDGTDAGRQLSLDAVQRLYDSGIKTYVIAVGNDVTEAHQRALANAGVGLPSDGNAPLHRPQDPGGLIDAFNQIIYGERSCVFTLHGEVVAGAENTGRVTLDGRPLANGDPNGYRLDSSSQIELVGAACTQVKTEPNPQLSVQFSCGGIMIR
jgi:hypothetical protein